MHTALVKTDVAAVDLGKSTRIIEQMVDGGSLQPGERGLSWVFDFANDLTAVNGKSGSHRRDLRFWRPELLARGRKEMLPGRTDINQVIAAILPVNRAIFHAGEVDQMFQIRPRTRIDLHSELDGKRKGGRFVYSRTALTSFLKRRWLSASHQNGKALAA